MSHELRTPLNSLLILAEMLADNPEGNLTPKQREFAQTIHASGSDLLSLINDILDMAKIESGTMAIDVGDVPFADLREYVERTFRPVAETKGLGLERRARPTACPRSISTDAKRLQQVLRNLLSNAFKFTEDGQGRACGSSWPTGGWSADHPVLSRADRVVAFAVERHGHRHPRRQAARSSSSRSSRPTRAPAASTAARAWACRSAGRSPGCSAARSGSRARLGEGSTFTLYLPLDYVAGRAPAPAGAGGAAARGGSRPAGPRPVDRPRGRPRSAARGRRSAATTATPIEPGDRVLLIVEHEPRVRRASCWTRPTRWASRP